MIAARKDSPAWRRPRYSLVTRVAGEGRFVANGIANDSATERGSLLEMDTGSNRLPHA